jgi:hypothetical protein
MQLSSTRLSDTQLRVANKLYGFRTRDEADRFEACLRDTDASQCVAQCPPSTTADADPTDSTKQSGAGITIGPPPGVLDNDG